MLSVHGHMRKWSVRPLVVTSAVTGFRYHVTSDVACGNGRRENCADTNKLTIRLSVNQITLLGDNAIMHSCS